MVEEIRDASGNLPKSILSAVGRNCGLGCLMAMTLIICVGDAETALSEANNYNGLTIYAISDTAFTSRQI
jgi:hypothetical protein